MKVHLQVAQVPEKSMITDEIELKFHEKFFIARDIEPYPVQEEALNHIFNDANILVTVPTGTGKTLIAKAAIYRAF